jgi:hypothetical protein
MIEMTLPLKKTPRQKLTKRIFLSTDVFIRCKWREPNNKKLRNIEEKLRKPPKQNLMKLLISTTRTIVSTRHPSHSRSRALTWTMSNVIKEEHKKFKKRSPF